MRRVDSQGRCLWNLPTKTDVEEETQRRFGYATRVDRAAQGRQAEARNLDPKTAKLIADKIRGLEFGPQLVIGNIVENTFGGEEAARYVIALVTGKAH